MNQVAVTDTNNPADVISHVEANFQKINTFKMDYRKEALFAMQALGKNDFLNKIAKQNPVSLRNAVLNVAAIGISLNPALADAYLVPRDNMVCLDISYKGLIKVATESGAMKWVQAELVYEKDTFVYKGPAVMPEHHSDPFDDDRGPVKGVYCIAKTADGDILTEVMNKDQLQKVKNASPAYKRNSGPWIEFEGEMSKKAVIKRASKRWPRVETDDRLREAINMLNENEGYEFDNNGTEVAVVSKQHVTQEQLALAAPKATQILGFIESGDAWEFGVMYNALEDTEKEALNVAKTKGGFFNTNEKQAISDLNREYFTERSEIQERIQSSIDQVAQCLLDGDEVGVSECIEELDDREFSVLCGEFEGDHLSIIQVHR